MKNTTIVEVKLKGTWYHNATAKNYTEVQEGKTPHVLLDILKENKYAGRMSPKLSLNNEILDQRPDLVTDEYGEWVSFDRLLSSLENGKLVECSGTNWEITPMGEQFLKNNIIEAS